MDGRSIRVLVADDRALVRQGIAEILFTDPGIKVVAQAADGREAVDLARQHGPDVVVLDVEMPVMSGQVALRKPLDLGQPPKVVIVNIFPAQSHLRELLALGVSGYLFKNSSMGDLISTVCSVVGEQKGQEKAEVILYVPHTTFDEADEESSLPGRKTEVLMLAARALSNREIARSLHLSATTVKRQLSNVCEKPRVSSRED